MNYPLIKKYLPELTFTYNPGEPKKLFVWASNLEALLSSGVEVFGQRTKGILAVSNEQTPSDTHSGLLIGYKPIEKEQPVSVDEIVSMLELADKHTEIGFREMINRLKLAGVK